MTSLARVLSHSRLSQPDQSVFKSHTSVYRSNVVQPGRRRRLSSSNSVESLDVSPCAEARVLVINTGGTIGMMYHNNGKAFLTGTFKVYLLLPKQSAFIWFEWCCVTHVDATHWRKLARTSSSWPGVYSLHRFCSKTFRLLQQKQFTPNRKLLQGKRVYIGQIHVGPSPFCSIWFLRGKLFRLQDVMNTLLARRGLVSCQM